MGPEHAIHGAGPKVWLCFACAIPHQRPLPSGSAQRFRDAKAVRRAGHAARSVTPKVSVIPARANGPGSSSKNHYER